ncbi:MAG TPA: hypothetical protein VF911_16315 [Thermoanaerobaculia bacterium]
MQRDAQTNSVLLKWATVDGATSYDVFFGDINEGCTSVRATVGATQWAPPPSDIVPGGTYSWRVVANGVANCQTPPASACSTFTVEACPNTAPALAAPAPNAQVPFGSVTLQWGSVPNADGYEGYLALDGDTPSLHFSQSGTSKTIVVEPGRTVTWYIVARANGCDGVQSAVQTFITNCPTGAPVLAAPSERATMPEGTPITFRWAAFPGANSYDVKVNDGNGWVIIGENLTDTQFTTTLSQGNYVWEVRANFDGSCGPAYSEPRQLLIGPNCSGNSASELLEPAHNATLQTPVTFAWTPRESAQGYALYVYQFGKRTPQLLTETTDTRYVSTELAPGTYEWWVRVRYGNCGEPESEHRTITIGGGPGCPTNPGRPTLVSPANGATNLTSPVTFTWNAVPDATGYRLIAAVGGQGEPSAIGSTTSTSLTVALPAGALEWGVEALFGDGCATTISEARRLTVTGGACTDTPPQIVSPANGATVSTQQVNFDWSPVAGATRYKLFVAAGNQDFDFYGETGDTSLERFVPEGNVRWFVIAMFASCPDVRSAVSTFTVAAGESCPEATLNLIAPADDATVTSPVRLAWSAVQGATAYRVWVSIDGSAPVGIARTTALDASVTLPAGEMNWYVEALRDGCDAVVSDTRTFTIDKGTACGTSLPPVLVSPTGTRDNPAHVDDRVQLDWNAVERAIGYRVWIGRNGEAYSDVALTRETSFELEVPKDGLYGWYVQAMFEACDPVVSAPAFFLVDDGEARCPTAAPSPISPAEGASSTAPVTFAWTAVAEAGKYRVYAALGNEEPRVVGTTDATTLTVPLEPGAYTWSVEAVFKDCPSTMSARAHFAIPRAQNCSTVGAQLVAPANDATNVAAPVDFVWSPVSGAVKYVLVARVNDGAPTALALTTDTHFVVDRVPPGAIEWWVVTYFAGCDAVDSAHARFTVARPENCDNRSPILLNPSGDVTSPVHFQWAGVPKATGYRVWIAQGAGSASVALSTDETEAELTLTPGTYEYFVEALFTTCASTDSARGEFTVIPPAACGTPASPSAQVVGQALANTTYRVRWTPVANAALYEVQESTSPDFANAQTFTISGTSLRFSHDVAGTPVQYLYRVRAISSCNDERGSYSDPIGVFVTPARTNNASTEIGAEGNVVQKLFLPGSTTPLTFVATVDKPWLTVSPSSGTLPVEGITLNVTADPSVLNLGTNTGTVKIEYTTASGRAPQTNASTVSSIPVSISLVTPVTPSGSGTPPPDSLIFPVVGHATGVNDSLFESDVRVTNLTAKTMKYALSFTPSATEGTQTSIESTIEIASGATLALDDVVASLFGVGTNSSATGMLEVRPLTTTSTTSSSLVSKVPQSAIKPLNTAGASRTYNFTPNGTFGQFIPAIRYSDFVGKAAAGAPANVLSLQQVAQSSAFRANFGFAEASGQPADLAVRVYHASGALLATIPVSLKGREHRQINAMLAANGITELTDGRVEVEVVGGTGKVTAYVSEVDNKTNDPLLVSPVLKGTITANRYIVPGTAYIQNASAFWVTDMRVFNAGAAPTPATLTFYPQGNPAGAMTREIVLGAGEIKVLDNVIGDLFGQPNGAGGMIAVTTPTATTLNATARTYNKTENGTYGQFIQGVTPAESVGAIDRPLQLLQLEQSSRFRTNIGVAETSGQPVTIEVTAIGPDTLTTPHVRIDLAANEFRQFSLGSFGLGDLYNARVSVKVVGGTGRVTAYGSAIDQKTQDPTYVPAQ